MKQPSLWTLVGVCCLMLALLCVSSMTAQEGAPPEPAPPSAPPEPTEPDLPSKAEAEASETSSPRVLAPSELDPITAAHSQSIVAFQPALAQAVGTPTFQLRLPSGLQAEQTKMRIVQSRLSIRLDQGVEPVELKYENERSQIPIIAGFFDEAKCDATLSAEVYRSRPQRYASLAFTIKAAPADFGAYTTIIEHWHVSEFGEVFLKAMQFEDLETFILHRVSVQGVLPGLNRFKLRLLYRNAAGVSTLSEGMSHFVTVHEVGAFDEQRRMTPTAQARAYGDLTIFEAGLQASYEFTLTPAVDPRTVKVRLLKKGARHFSSGGIKPEPRKVIGVAAQSGTFRMASECALIDGKQTPEFTVRALGGRRYQIDMHYLLSMTSSVLPVSDEWSYRIEIRSGASAMLLQSQDIDVKAEIPTSQGGTLSYGVHAQAMESVPIGPS